MSRGATAATTPRIAPTHPRPTQHGLEVVVHLALQGGALHPGEHLAEIRVEGVAPGAEVLGKPAGYTLVTHRLLGAQVVVSVALE